MGKNNIYNAIELLKRISIKASEASGLVSRTLVSYLEDLSPRGQYR